MIDKELPKINLHAHINKEHGLKQHLKECDEWNIRYLCCLCMPEHTWWAREKGYFSNKDYLNIKDEYGDRILGFAGVN